MNHIINKVYRGTFIRAYFAALLAALGGWILLTIFNKVFTLCRSEECLGLAILGAFAYAGAGFITFTIYFFVRIFKMRKKLLSEGVSMKISSIVGNYVFYAIVTIPLSLFIMLIVSL